MRPLAAICIVVAAALHVAAWRMLDLRVLTVLADEPVPVPIPVEGIEVEQPVAQEPAAVPQVTTSPAAASASELAKDEVTAWRPPQAAPEAKEPAAGLPRTPGREPAPAHAAETSAAPAWRARELSQV